MADSLILSPSYRLYICRGDGRTRTGDRGFADPCLIHLGHVALRNEPLFEPFYLLIILSFGCCPSLAPGLSSPGQPASRLPVPRLGKYRGRLVRLGQGGKRSCPLSCLSVPRTSGSKGRDLRVEDRMPNPR